MVPGIPKVIVNPAAGQGNAGRFWPEIGARLTAALGKIDVVITENAGSEKFLTEQALKEGYRHFIAVGGDGTMNGVMNGVVRSGQLADSDVRLSVVPAGTANELARSIGVHGDIEGAVNGIADGKVQRFDLLQLVCANLAGEDITHYGILAVSWGGAAEIVYRTNNSHILKKLGGRFSYYVNTMLVTLTYPNRLCDLTIDGKTTKNILHYSGLICNVEMLGGGMRLAPGAIHNDGIANLLFFKDIPRRDILLQKPSWLFQGHHIEHEKIDYVIGRDFTINGSKKALVDVDGETIGRLPLKVKTLNQIMPIIG